MSAEDKTSNRGGFSPFHGPLEKPQKPNLDKPSKTDYQAQKQSNQQKRHNTYKS